MRTEYNDRWKKFLKRALKNIDYLSYDIPDEVVEEMTYLLEPISIKEGNNLFEAGTMCTTIHIVSEGEIDMFVNNNGEDTYVDTLYTGCTIGAYSALMGEEYTMTSKAKTDCSLLRLPVEKLIDFRHKSDILDKTMADYELYCEKNGLPYCDYKLHRTKNLTMKPIEKFQ